MTAVYHPRNAAKLDSTLMLMQISLFTHSSPADIMLQCTYHWDSKQNNAKDFVLPKPCNQGPGECSKKDHSTPIILLIHYHTLCAWIVYEFYHLTFQCNTFHHALTISLLQPFL